MLAPPLKIPIRICVPVPSLTAARMTETTETAFSQYYSRFRVLVTEYFLPLIASIPVAMIWANADPSGYNDFWGTEDATNKLELFTWRGHAITLHFLVNDIFMSLFFGMAAVEIVGAVSKGGALYPWKRAMGPLLGTMGGVLGPVIVFFILCAIEEWADVFEKANSGHEEDEEEIYSFDSVSKGWGIVISTDISVAWLYASILFGRSHHAVMYMLLLAVADDVIGLFVIAGFYSDPKGHEAEPERIYLLLVGAAMALAHTLTKLGIHHYLPYIVVCGTISWIGMFFAGLHPALALCPIIPFMPKWIDPEKESGCFPKGTSILHPSLKKKKQGDEEQANPSSEAGGEVKVEAAGGMGGGGGKPWRRE